MTEFQGDSLLLLVAAAEGAEVDDEDEEGDA